MFLTHFIQIKNNITLIISFVLLLISCHAIENRGDKENQHPTQKQDYSPSRHVSVNFSIENGLIVIPITINEKQYHFLFDTGSPTLISPALATMLHAPSTKPLKLMDAQGNTRRLNFVKIDTISIKEEIFTNISAGIVDFQQVDAIACLNIDGVIGANLIGKTCWQIDYKKQQLHIALDPKSLLQQAQHTTKRYCIPFDTDMNGTPMIPLKIGNIEIKDVKIDTGSVGFISIDPKYYNDLKENNAIVKQRTAYGTNLAGLFGTAKKDSIKQLLVQHVTFGTHLSMTDQIIDLRSTNLSLIGNAFLHNFTVTIDSKKKCLLLETQGDFYNSFAHSFGINVQKEQQEFIVSMITDGSAAQNYGLEVGDTILQINQIDFSTHQVHDYCQIIRLFRSESTSSIYLVWKKNGIKNECVLKPLPLLSEMDD